MGWFASDCEVAVQPTTSITYHMGFLFGVYVSTFDGASYVITTSGLYQVLKSATLSIQALYWPCPGDLTCRYLKEITIRNGAGALSILGSLTGDMQLYDGTSEISTFPYETTVQSISVKWIYSDYIR